MRDSFPLYATSYLLTRSHALLSTLRLVPLARPCVLVPSVPPRCRTPDRPTTRPTVRPPDRPPIRQPLSARIPGFRLRQSHPVVIAHTETPSIHKSAKVRALCGEFGVRLEFLPPYSPHYNPIEESFTELRAWIRTVV